MKKRKDGLYQKSVTINGKRVYFYSSAPNARQAEKDFNAQLLAYHEKEEKGKLFKDVAEEWLDRHEKNIEYQTYYRYKVLMNHATDWFEGKYIKDIKIADMSAFLESLAENRYSTKTIKDQFSVLKMIFKYARIKRYIETDETAYVEKPKGKPKVERRELQESEIRIIKQNTDTLMGLFAYFLLYTGMRKSEALALQWKDIDFKNKTIDVYKSVFYKGNMPYIKKPKTAAGTRKIILTDNLVEKLIKGMPNAYVFTYDGNLMTLYTYDKHWKEYLEKTGLNFTAHQLRHTFATMLFEANISEKDAQKLMGHADITTTQNIYTHIRETHFKDTAKLFNQYIENKDVRCK